jgi:NAD(P)H dehydrogenase (quinone)
MKLPVVALALLLLAAVPTGAAEPDDPIQILVAYHSETGNTEALAGLVRDGVASVEGVEARLRRLEAVTDDDILQAEGILLGTPVHWSTVSVETRVFLDRVGGVLMQAGALEREGRTAGAFCTGGGVAMGKEMARLTILNSFLTMRFVVVGGVEGEGFGTLGPEATTPDPKTPMTAEEKASAQASGERFARLTRQIARGVAVSPP